MNSGYICLYRAIEDHWLWLDPKRLRAWLYLLFAAKWEPCTVTFGKDTIELKRGQIATTTRRLMGRFDYYSKATLDFLKVLEKEGMITCEKSSKLTIITIVNYDKYQVAESNPERKTKRKTKHIKEIEEVKKEEVKINNSLPTSSRESELKFFEELFTQEIFWEESAMTFKSTIPILKEIAERFKAETLAKENFHPSLQELKKHFINWARYALRNEAAPKKINSTQNGQQPKQKTDSKRANRRGTGVTDLSESELRSSFQVRNGRTKCD
ncbi:MAG: hypothetical protein NC311_17135 [Muribaculaceae bacterium]|nr:hypothetical protein [Muribaculaceae bacterium]